MSELENKAKEVAEQAKNVTKVAVDDVKEEAQQLKADAKGYAQGALEDVKAEGKEVVEEIKAAVRGEKLDSAGTEGAAGYRSKDGAQPSGIAIASVALGVFSILLGGWLIKVLLGVVSAVLGAKARKENQTTLATIGFVLGAVGCILGVLSFLF